MNAIHQLHHDYLLAQTRRHFLRNCTTGLGALWLASSGTSLHGAALQKDSAHPLLPVNPPLPAKAKRVIYLHMCGAPSQLELYDRKPELIRLNGMDCPKSFLEGKQFAFIQGVPKMLGGQFPFAQHGQSGQWLSDRLPNLATVADELCVIRSMYTDQFNHGPAQLLMHTGSQQPGYPSIGAWSTYGLGSENQNLPGYIVLTSGGKNPDAGKSIWGAGFLPSVYQGVQCRSQGEPVLFLNDPPGITRNLRQRSLEAIDQVNHQTATDFGDPETLTRVAQYEMAFRMQVSATDAFDLSQEPKAVHDLYGTEIGKESLANNCLLARRLIERGVRYVQLFDWGWDSHGESQTGSLTGGFKDKCRKLDRPAAALIKDLRQRGLLDDTLVVWSGEFGRTSMQENRNGNKMAFVGRDHNPGAYTLWMAGGGAKPGTSYGETDDMGYQAVIDRVSVHDFHATMLHLLGFDHLRFTYPFRGLNQRLTNVTAPGSRVVKEALA
jgi:hypothetical protein